MLRVDEIFIYSTIILDTLPYYSSKVLILHVIIVGKKRVAVLYDGRAGTGRPLPYDMHLLNVHYTTVQYSFYQHAHFIQLVRVGKERRTLIGPW